MIVFLLLLDSGRIPSPIPSWTTKADHMVNILQADKFLKEAQKEGEDIKNKILEGYEQHQQILKPANQAVRVVHADIMFKKAQKEGEEIKNILLQGLEEVAEEEEPSEEETKKSEPPPHEPPELGSTPMANPMKVAVAASKFKRPIMSHFQALAQLRLMMKNRPPITSSSSSYSSGSESETGSETGSDTESGTELDPDDEGQDKDGEDKPEENGDGEIGEAKDWNTAYYFNKWVDKVHGEKRKAEAAKKAKEESQQPGYVKPPMSNFQAMSLLGKMFMGRGMVRKDVLGRSSTTTTTTQSDEESETDESGSEEESGSDEEDEEESQN